jgi:hypothetical protein
MRLLATFKLFQVSAEDRPINNGDVISEAFEVDGAVLHGSTLIGPLLFSAFINGVGLVLVRF